MSTIANWFQKAYLTGITAAVALVAVPSAGAFAISPADSTTPPVQTPVPHPRLEWAWAQEQKVYNRMGNFFDHVDDRIAKGQELIDKAKANGKDVTTVQSALNSFSNAVKQAKQVYQGGSSIVSSHAGFDVNGFVTDPQQALQTVSNLRDALKQVRDLLTAPAQALRAAIQAFRQANPPVSSPTPTSNSG